MDSLSHIEEPLPKAPRWLQIFFGILLAPMALLCLAASAVMVVSPAPGAPVLAVVLGGLFILICAWLVVLATRLITNRPRRGGLMGPFALRASAALFLTLPVLGLFTGYYQERGLIAVGQAAIYVLVAVALWSLARRRSRAV